MGNELVNFLRLFRHIPAGDAELISAAWERRVLEEGHALSVPGKTCRELFFICKGVLRIVMPKDSGDEVIHYFLKENQFCTILNSFTKETPAEERIAAACNTEVMAIRKERLLQLYGQLPYLKVLVEQVIQQGLLDKIQTRNAYLGLDSTARYKLFIMRQPEIALRVPQSNIASYLGITPQSLSRIRRNIR